MHPAKSIIAFTTLSGAGYGLLFALALAGLFDQLPPELWFNLVAFGLGLGLTTVGLLFSTLHLGHPERAWRAVTQWRTSWLSREGVLALLTFIPAVALAWGLVFEEQLWLWAAAVLLVLAPITVFATSMIYASLKPIRQWRQRLVPPLYLLFAATSGTLIYCALVALWDRPLLWPLLLGLALLLVTWVVKVVYWRQIDSAPPLATPESATGLGALGQVRMLEPPHTEENYLLREMGYQVARKHAGKLRRIAVLLGGLLPLVLLAVAFAGMADIATVLAALCCLAGILTERWLFFAEAKHTVTLFYGRRG